MKTLFILIASAGACFGQPVTMNDLHLVFTNGFNGVCAVDFDNPIKTTFYRPSTTLVTNAVETDNGVNWKWVYKSSDGRDVFAEFKLFGSKMQSRTKNHFLGMTPWVDCDFNQDDISVRMHEGYDYCKVGIAGKLIKGCPATERYTTTTVTRRTTVSIEIDGEKRDVVFDKVISSVRKTFKISTVEKESATVDLLATPVPEESYITNGLFRWPLSWATNNVSR